MGKGKIVRSPRGENYKNGLENHLVMVPERIKLRRSASGRVFRRPVEGEKRNAELGDAVFQLWKKKEDEPSR